LKLFKFALLQILKPGVGEGLPAKQGLKHEGVTALGVAALALARVFQQNKD